MSAGSAQRLHRERYYIYGVVRNARASLRRLDFIFRLEVSLRSGSRARINISTLAIIVWIVCSVLSRYTTVFTPYLRLSPPCHNLGVTLPTRLTPFRQVPVKSLLTASLRFMVLKLRDSLTDDSLVRSDEMRQCACISPRQRTISTRLTSNMRALSF